MIRFSFNIGYAESKVIFKPRKKQNMSNKNALQGANVRTSSISLRTPARKQTQSTPGRMVNTQKSPPWACDKGCAEACAERFSALKGRSCKLGSRPRCQPPPTPPSSSKQKCYFAVRVAVIDFVRILRHLIYSLCIILIYMQLPEGFGMYMKTAYWRISSREVTKLIEYTIWIASSAPVCPLLHALKWQYPVAQTMNSAIDRINH